MERKPNDQENVSAPRLGPLRRLLQAGTGTLGAFGLASLARSAGASIPGVSIEYRRCHVAFVSNASGLDTLAVYYSDAEGRRRAVYGIDPTTTDPRGYSPLVVEYDADEDRTQVQLAEPRGALVCVIAEAGEGRATRINPTETCIPDGFNTAPTASFTVSDERPRVGNEVTFTSTATDLDDPERLYHEWDLDGDGTYETTGATATTTYAAAGEVTIGYRVTDDCGLSDTATRTIEVRPPNKPPEASFTIGTADTDPTTGEITVTVDEVVAFSSTATDPNLPDDTLSYEWDLDGDGTFESSGEVVTTAYDTVEAVTVTHRVTDEEGLDDTATATVTVEPLNEPPTASFTAETADTPPTSAGITVDVDEGVTFTSTATDPNLPGDTLSYDWDLDGDGSFESSGEVVSTSYGTADVVTVTHRVTDAVGESDTAATLVTVESETTVPEVPEEPTAPELDQTVITKFADRASYLYSGEDAVQTGVDVSAFQDYRTAVVRGVVRERGGGALPGVTVTVNGNPEFGQTLTRADGRYDLVINGGGRMTLDFELDGYLPAQRSVSVPWEEYVFVPDLAMVPVTTPATTVQMGASTPQTVVGSTSSDSDGDRKSVLFFPSGVAAVADGDGGTVVPESLSVRAVEYTVGDDGEDAMPGRLPPTSAYTYAVELMADYDTSSGSTDSTTRPLMTLDGAGEIRFDTPIINYVENFLGFAVGGAVPAGYYDAEKRVWVASENGRVIEILAIVDGKATLDIDGSGTAADATALAALGVTDEEREQLAGQYPVGQQLWRTPIPHFTPWDCNWPFGAPEEATFPNQPYPRENERVPEDPCKQTVSR